MSFDGSREIAKQFKKVQIVENHQKELDEDHRKRLLHQTARDISQNAVLVALDADEFLSGNFTTEPEWANFVRSSPGTAASLRWLQVLPGSLKAWDAERQTFAYIDDGKVELPTAKLHGPRIILQANKTVQFNRVAVLHYHYTDWQDVLHKIRFYQCLEFANNPKKKTIETYRFYNKYQYIHKLSEKLDPAMLQFYREHGIDMTSLTPADPEKWQKRALDLMVANGPEAFEKAHVWGVDWRALARKYNYENSEMFSDPRSFRRRLLHSYLFRTQPQMQSPWVRRLDQFLSQFFD